MVTTPLIAEDRREDAGVRAITDLLVGFKYIGQVMDREGPDGVPVRGGGIAGVFGRPILPG